MNRAFAWLDGFVTVTAERLRPNPTAPVSAPWPAPFEPLYDGANAVLALSARRHDADPATRRAVGDALAAMAERSPTLALTTAARWRAEDGPAVEPLLERGLRPLVERRDPAALRLAGFAPEAPVRVGELAVVPSTITIGEPIRIYLRIVSTATHDAGALIDWRVVERDDARIVAGAILLRRTLRPLTALALHRIIDTSHPPARWPAGQYRLVVSVNSRDDAAADFSLRRR